MYTSCDMGVVYSEPESRMYLRLLLLFGILEGNSGKTIGSPCLHLITFHENISMD